jgi:hypothetical protein
MKCRVMTVTVALAVSAWLTQPARADAQPGAGAAVTITARPLLLRPSSTCGRAND